MSDDNSRSDENGIIGGSDNAESINLYPTVTDSLDTIFGLLSDPHRRYLLYYLFTMDGNVTEFDAAVNAVYTCEAAGAETDNHATRETIRIDLHHIHLPQLADAEIIDYDHRHKTIRIRETPAIEEWVEHAQYKELD